MKDVVSDEVDRYANGSAGLWSEVVRSDALYRTALWTKVAERVVAEEINKPTTENT